MRSDDYKNNYIVESAVIKRNKNIDIILKTIEFFDTKSKGENTPRQNCNED